MTVKTNKPNRRRQRKPYAYPYPFKWVFQFEIALQGIEPTIWRRIQVPDVYTFWDLHCAITDSLGWLDYHLHLFTIKNPKTGKEEHLGIPDDDFMDEDDDTIASWEKPIGKYFTLKNTTCDYLYDFGDSWHHSVTLEGILPREKGVSYPFCVSGERACPPEDVGSWSGYQRFLRSIAYLNAEDHADMLHWVGGWFDPEWFDLNLVRFEDPKRRFEVAFCGKEIPDNMRVEQYHRLRKSTRHN
jgi:hypothetical protein